MSNKQENSFIQAQEYEHKNQFDLAVQYYQQAIASKKGDQALAYQGLCRALALLKRFDEAINEGQKWLELNPNLPIIRRTLGNIYVLQGDRNQAGKEFLLALALEPDNPVNLKNLAIVYMDLGEYNKAIELLQKFHKLCPEDLEVRLALADLYTQQRYYKAAIIEANQLFKTNPTFLRLYLIYALVPIRVISKAFLGLSPLGRIGGVILLLSVAAFTPPLISAPLGILLSAYLFLGFVVVASSGKGFRYILRILFFIVVLSGIYWFFVWLHYHIGFWGAPVMQNYFAYR